MSKLILIIIDSVGIGEMPDASVFGDEGADTFGHIYQSDPDMSIDHLKRLGLNRIPGMDYITYEGEVIGASGKMKEVSNGKDTTTGHWEIAGLRIDTPFKTYPDGFPERVMTAFESRIGTRTLCNQPASGTVIIEELGEEHMATGYPIVYTSADSVFQIAAHESIIPLERLYEMCEIARAILIGEDQVARVIARPFTGTPGHFERTPNRRDYSLDPFGKTILDHLKDAGFTVAAVGKIVDIFNGNGITDDVHTVSNMDGVDKTLAFMEQEFDGLIFTNLVDFDAKFGHRRDIEGYRKAIEAFDARLPEILEAMGPEDLLLITADHGNDPAYRGTDHTREMVPLLAYRHGLVPTSLGIRETFADIAATIADFFDVMNPGEGTSFLSMIKEKNDVGPQ